MTDSPLRDSALQLARDIRRAHRAFDATVQRERDAYDAATFEEERMGAATNYLLAIGTAHHVLTSDIAAAKQTFSLRQERLVREAGTQT